MQRQCTLDNALKQEDRKIPGRLDEEVGVDLLTVMKATRSRIQTAFAHDKKFVARLKAH